mgnify:CR=1 FL=1
MVPDGNRANRIGAITKHPIDKKMIVDANSANPIFVSSLSIDLISVILIMCCA